ncbi:MAG: membrane protein insertion efficiency factor YidD [Sphaerochaetaceae bacterium]
MKLKAVVREIFLFPTHLYRLLISPYLPSSCIYDPTCSSYMVQSVRRHGIFKGFVMGMGRILRCHTTFFIGGYDPVPEHFSCKEVKDGYTIFKRNKKKKS